MVNRILVLGSAYLALVCLLPEVLRGQFAIPFYFGGTSVLIVVSVTMDTIQQVQSHLLAHQYEGLIEKSQLRGKNRKRAKRSPARKGPISSFLDRRVPAKGHRLGIWLKRATWCSCPLAICSARPRIAGLKWAIRPDVVADMRANDRSFLEAIIAGAFTVPGDGCIDFQAVANRLATENYAGWIVVEAEQDPAKEPAASGRDG